MAEIWLEMVVKQQLVSLLIYGTPSRSIRFCKTYCDEVIFGGAFSFLYNRSKKFWWYELFMKIWWKLIKNKHATSKRI